MLWYYNKISEDDNSVLYAYGWKPDEITGQLKYIKAMMNTLLLKLPITILKKAPNGH